MECISVLLLKKSTFFIKYQNFLDNINANDFIDSEIYPLALGIRLGRSAIAIIVDIVLHSFHRKKKKMLSILESTKGAERGIICNLPELIKDNSETIANK